MTNKNKVLSSVLISSLLLICFQNCGQPKQQTSSPIDDHVIKLCPPGSEGLEGCPAANTNENLDFALLSDALTENIAELPEDPRDQINIKLRWCSRLAGSQRLDCLDEAIKAYYEALSKVGYVVTSGIDCYLAYKKNLNGSAHFDSICRSRLRVDERRGLHLDECLKFPSKQPAAAVESAFALYRRAKNYERLDSIVRYVEKNQKHVEIYEFNRNSPVFVDKCKNEQHAEASGTYVEL
jgi:hypothetical protein